MVPTGIAKPKASEETASPAVAAGAAVVEVAPVLAVALLWLPWPSPMALEIKASASSTKKSIRFIPRLAAPELTEVAGAAVVAAALPVLALELVLAAGAGVVALEWLP